MSKIRARKSRKMTSQPRKEIQGRDSTMTVNIVEGDMQTSRTSTDTRSSLLKEESAILAKNLDHFIASSELEER
jgi:hypothetical protein